MEEIIKNIKIIDNFKLDEKSWSAYEGYEIETNIQKIYVLISNFQGCCESFGYLSTPDNPEEFIGKILRSVNVVDTFLDKKIWDTNFPYGLDEGGAMFVNFETNNGTFQLAVYNNHNGYYGHDVKLISKQLTVNDGI